MLEKDPEGLIEALMLAGISIKEDIVMEKKLDGSVSVIRIKTYTSFINDEKARRGPFISEYEKSVLKVFPKRFGFTLKKDSESVIFS